MADLPQASQPADERLRALDIWTGVPRIEPCGGGRTNQNFRVEDGGRAYFARVGVDLPHHFLQRTNEARAYRLAAEAGVAPRLIHAGNGILITDFIDGRTLRHDEPTSDADLLLIADALKRIHATPIPPELNAFDPAAICRGYLDGLPPSAMDVGKRQRLLDALDRAPALRASSLIHADLIAENVIVTLEHRGGERAYIIDWEYAGRGDPAVDLAQVIVLFELDARQATLLVDRHGGAGMATIQALRPVLAAREVLWCESQAHHVGVKGDLADYRALCWSLFDRATA
ncbi:MAG: phosphotransferase family protein [Rhodospirillales bacterium]|nr:phosphotransferase family protein [Rhodospirillales bacterium]